MGVIGRPTAHAPDWETAATVPSENEKWDEMTLDFTKNSVPLGNGFFGISHGGNAGKETFSLNHKGFWSGDPQLEEDIRQGKEIPGDTQNYYQNTPADRLDAVTRVRQLLKEAYTEGISYDERLKKMQEANDAAMDMWCATYQATYLPMGNMVMEFDGMNNTANYRRILNMDSARSEVSFEKNGGAYTRQAFTSNPDKVMVVKIANEKNEPMTMRVSMSLPSQMRGKAAENKVAVEADKNEVVMTGRAPIYKNRDWKEGTWVDGRGTTFEARVKAIPVGGTTREEDGKLVIEDATEIVLIYSCESSYKDPYTDPANSGVDVAGNVRKSIDAVAEKGYDELLTTHQEDFRSLFRRLWIELDGDPIRLDRSSVEVTPEQYAKHYQYTRYRLISAERENADNVPHGLFGIWNSNWSPSNEGSYFLNEYGKGPCLSGTGESQRYRRPVL